MDQEAATRPVIVAGDLHGNLQWARHLIRSAHTADARTLVQVGDLGILWPGAMKGRWDTRLSKYLKIFDMELIFIDGNHDNHKELRDIEIQSDGLATVLPHIRYLPRGSRTVIQGMTVGGLGGAFSVDYQWRKRNVSWWPRIEEVEPQDVDKLIAGGPVDVLLTHDVPAAVPMKSKWPDLDTETLSRAQVSRDLLQQAVEALKPPQVFSGHWHTRQTSTISHPGGTKTRVDILDMDGSKDGNAVLLWPDTPARVEPLIVGRHAR